MINKIIYIHETFFRKNRDMGIDIFIEKGYKVELWSNLRIKYKNKLDIPKDNTDYKVLYFDNHIQIIKEIFKQNWENTIAFFTTTAHRGGVEDFMRIAIRMAGGRYCNFIYEITPVGHIVFIKNTKESIKAKVKYVFNKYKESVYKFLINKLGGPTFCFVPTYYATNGLLSEQEKKVVIEVHNKDYDEYLQNQPKEEEEKYILFIDDDIADSEDFRKEGVLGIYPSKAAYFENINKLFSKLEDIYKIPVYIAAHPKSNYKGNEFGNRKIFYFQTSKLTQNAELVLTHMSCAINFVMLYRRPYILLIDKYIRRHGIWRYLILPGIKALRAKPYYFDSEQNPLDYINQPNDNYDLYIKRYIKHDNFNRKLFYEIVEEKIRHL